MTDYQNYINEKVWEYLPPEKVKVGDDINFRCPFCGDSRKSRTKKRGHYSLSKGVYHCFNCDCSMSGLKLLEYLSGASFDDIKTNYIKMKLKSGGSNGFESEITRNSGLKSNLSVLNEIKSIVKPEWKQGLSEKAMEYLTKRKVFESPFLGKRKFYSVTAKSGIEYILIPWALNSIDYYYQLNDFQHLDKAGRKYIFPRNTEKPIYGLDEIDLTWPYIIVFEGVYDSLFVKNGVCSGGKTLTDFQYSLIKERYPNHEIVLAFDNDRAGMEAIARKISQDVGKFKYFKWFDNTIVEKDINDRIIALNDLNAFSNKVYLEKMIVSSVEMKMFLIENGIWSEAKPKKMAIKSPSQSIFEKIKMEMS